MPRNENPHVLDLLAWHAHEAGGVRVPFRGGGEPLGRVVETPLVLRLKALAADIASGARSPRWVFLVGGPGNGKSQMVELFVRELGARLGCEPQLVRLAQDAFSSRPIPRVVELGESRPQQLVQRTQEIASPVHWHLIGNLQRNKVRRVLPHVALLHSGDSEILLTAVNEEARVAARRVPVLLEMNISGDSAKHGFAPAELESLVPRLAQFESLDVRGLMAMAGLESDSQQTRHEFAGVRELRDRLQLICPPSIRLDELSMGMSGDFEIAIEEGATIVRIGSALFEGVAS